ncbi:315aa long hypothetical protein [Pyrococcus horikoshii OT3]|uniref:DUF1177 domain-containing protein n=2 Tax=Pyrococcus horikoshii TaxID=53953 RepID=O58746_PYRHO|nr:315aa long hypothetical protein [Pyrococcus horikoshii OT3]
MVKMLKQVIEAYELLDSAYVTGEKVAKFLRDRGIENVEVKTITGEKGSTDFIKIIIPGKNGKLSGGDAPTLGIIGRLGGIGARPEMIGLVSDADGAITAIAVALKLADMRRNGDILDGDVIIATHICPNAPTQPHDPVPFMGSPVDMATMNRYEVDPSMDAILSVDTTKGNRIINIRGFAITPTVKEGWILRVSEDLLDIMQYVTGRMPAVVPITMQDITPYGNGIYHLNSIMQPATTTNAPVVGVAITAEVPVPGCATGASHIVDIEEAARFCIEVAKGFGRGKVKFYDEEEFKRLIELYGPMNHLQTLGRQRK